MDIQPGPGFSSTLKKEVLQSSLFFQKLKAAATRGFPSSFEKRNDWLYICKICDFQHLLQRNDWLYICKICDFQHLLHRGNGYLF